GNSLENRPFLHASSRPPPKLLTRSSQLFTRFSQLIPRSLQLLMRYPRLLTRSPQPLMRYLRLLTRSPRGQGRAPGPVLPDLETPGRGGTLLPRRCAPRPPPERSQSPAPESRWGAAAASLSQSAVSDT